MSDLSALIGTAGFGSGIVTAFGLLLRANILKDKLFAEHMKEMLEATKAGARADYAVASALQRIEQKLGLAPSNAGAPQPAPSPAPAPAGAGQP